MPHRRQPAPRPPDPVGTSVGNAFGTGKSLPLIAMAHEIPYVATATVADLHDLEAKVAKAMSMHGARYLHVLVPCPLGWGSASAETIRIARLATQCGLFPIFEAEHGAVTRRRRSGNRSRSRTTCSPQSRFAHLFRWRGTARRGRRAPGARRPQHRPLRTAAPRRQP